MISENMTNSIFRKAASSLAANGNIQEKYVELYAKAMEAVLAMGINLVSVLVIGYLCGMWWHGVILMVMFIPLRSYAGGYHAGGYVSCYLESCGLLTFSLLTIRYVVLTGYMPEMIWQLFFLSVIVIFMLAPLADKNKPISENEAKVFKTRTRIVLLVEAIIVMVLSWLRIDYVYSVIFAISLSAFALVLQCAVEYMQGMRKQDKEYS